MVMEGMRRAARRVNEYFGTDSIAYASERRAKDVDLRREVEELRRDVARLQDQVAGLRDQAE